ncbi:site-specific DNA-methyltransferase [Arthrobacter methylotrophus]|uniref:Site-specific DNA-methyltransferase n=1 Tax=Arthrobacter methylotrophus TaxID=121291 RepID=A0ABV5UP31_9MICC
MSIQSIAPVSGIIDAAHMASMPLGTTAAAETTSSLERYLAEIPDPVLRENLAREIGGLKREFGLVFERHHPEGIRLPKHAVKRGSKVVISGAKDSVFYRVHRLNKEAGTAIIVDTEGNQSEHPVASLTVAKEFGDVMYPGLRKLSEIRRGDPDAPVHTIINGENYHALEALQYTHAGKVDLIYIDPPYNTGNSDWKYNDRYVDAKDGYRHSKWLSFMEKRLQIAKSLLKPTGVLIMAIDDNEQSRLKMLCDQVIGEQNFIANVVWQGGTNNTARFVDVGHDYMLVYARDMQSLSDAGTRWREVKPGADEILAAAKRAWNDSGQSESEATIALRAWWKSRGKDGLDPGLWEYKHIDNQGRVFRPGDLSAPDKPETRSHRPIVNPETGELSGVPSRGWALSDSSMDSLLAQGRIYFGSRTVPARKVFLEETTQQVARGVFTAKRTSAAQHLTRVLGSKNFPFPKDVDVLARWINIATSSSSKAIVLDFFGGTGTTAEAVIRLNAEDSGTRQAILVTNNELSRADDAKLRKAAHTPGDDEYEALGVFHHVTKPRLETVVTGIREDGSTYSEGLDANIAFFELTYLDEPDIVRGAAFNDLAGLFWLKAGGVGGTVELTAGAKADGFAISESGRTAVLFTPGRAQALAEKLAATEHAISHLFIVTDSEAQGDEAATHFPGGITVERIYGSYLEAFQVNRKD